MKSLYAGLEDYWALHEASGNRSSAIGKHTLTDTNTVTQNPGKVVYAGQFTSANSERLTVASDASLQAGDIDFTLACWVYLDSKPASSMVFMGKYNTGSGQREYILRWVNTTDRMTFMVHKATDTAMDVSGDTFGAPSLSTWYFVTGWHDAVNNIQGVGVNMIEDTAATTGALQAASAAGFNIGATDVPNLFMNGRVCEAGFWKRVLTTQEKWWLYNRGLGRTYPFDGRVAPIMLGRDHRHRRRRITGVIT